MRASDGGKLSGNYFLRNMAQERSSQQRMQDIVRAVFANLNSLPESSAIISNGTVSVATSNANSSISAELNRSFQIPRGAVGSGNSALWHQDSPSERTMAPRRAGQEDHEHSPVQVTVADFNHTIGTLHLRPRIVILITASRMPNIIKTSVCFHLIQGIVSPKERSK